MSAEPTVYLDANATYGLLAEVSEVLPQYYSRLYNPSSIYSTGLKARAVVEEARASVSKLVGADERGWICFTSGATESNNCALLMPFWELLAAGPDRTAGCVLSAVEHPSVIAPAARLSGLGFSVARVSPRDRRFDASDFAAACSESTRLVSVILANNETGQILPVSEIASAVKERFPNVLVHCDAVQALGKIPVNFEELGVDLLSLSAHKVGGLGGVGALVVRRGVAAVELICGGGQERQLRAGTENVLGIASFGVAAELIAGSLSERMASMRSGRQLLQECFRAELPHAVFHTEGLECLPNTLNVRFPGAASKALVIALDREGVFISAGAACKAADSKGSAVLTALGVDPAAAAESVRFSVRAETPAADIARAAEAVVRCVRRVRRVG